MFPPRHDPDAPIRATDTDASQARLSAVRKHYLQDPFIASLIPRSHLVAARPPLINIGTYVRSEAIDELVLSWMESASLDGKKAQIVSLGAGSDTRFWRIATGLLGKGGQIQEVLARYLELDFLENTARKVMAIRQKKELASVIGEATAKDGSLTSSIYAIRDVDLRNFQSRFSDFLAPVASDETSNLSKPLLDSSLPTLVIAECVLVYMDPAQSDALIQWFADTFSVAGAIAYEMFALDDNFGRVMKANLKTRRVTLPGVDAYPTLDAQSRRFTNHGFTSAHAVSLRTIRNQHISPAELDRYATLLRLLSHSYETLSSSAMIALQIVAFPPGRIAKLELLDEIEELELVLDHYVVSWGIKQPAGKDPVRDKLATWGLKAKPRVRVYM